MTIAEILNFVTAQGFVNHAPFVYSLLPGSYKAASYWVTKFGALDQSRTGTIFIQAFTRAVTVAYTKRDTLQDCIDNEQSFFWDNANQKLYVHFEHDQEGDTDVYQYSEFLGFSDRELIYIDNQEYLPLIESVPSVKQSVDIINYSKPSFVNGSIKLRNTGGRLDNFIKLKINGNDVLLYYINDEDISYVAETATATRSALKNLAAFFLEDRVVGIKNVIAKVQDKRKQQTATVALDEFEISDYPDLDDNVLGEPIPIGYGPIREARAYPTNGATVSGSVNFRVMIEMAALGTVQALVDNVWTTKTPTSFNLATGEFTLSSSDAREASGAVRDVKVVDCEGVSITYAADVISDLENRYSGIPFDSAFYDLTEWNSEKLALSEIGVLFDSQITIADAAKLVQDGSNVGFRYYITREGKRSIRVDDETRAVSFRIPNVNIKNLMELSVSTDSKNLYSDFKVKYAKSYFSGKFLSVKNNDFQAQVRSNFKKTELLTTETLLPDSTKAEDRALYNASRFSEIPELLKLILFGGSSEVVDKFLQANIFDIVEIELTPADFIDVDNDTIDGREFYGIVKAKIVETDPKPGTKINNIGVELIR
jgi:hypothetical protein